MYQRTTALKKIQRLTKRIKVIQGGTSASKTVSILLYLIDKAQRDTTPTTTDVTAETLPHLKMGARKDFLSIMMEHKYFVPARWNKTDNIYTFETGSMMHFYGMDSPQKVRGPRRDRLFINEANNVSYPVFDQMEVRTKEEVIIDFNPVVEFWAHTEVIGKMDHDFLRLTYLDNEAIPPEIKRSIEAKRDNKNWWRVFGLGEIGIREGQVFDEVWAQLDEVPDDARLERRGLDYGYTNHPSALVDIYKWNDDLILDERLYRTGMNNDQIADAIEDAERDTEPVLVVGDSAEPKSNDAIAARGIQIIGATKGPGSVNQGIDVMKSKRIFVTKRSTNIIREKNNYLWKTDRDGKPLNTPVDAFNHAMDAARYGIVDLIGSPEVKADDLFFT